jgi:hypothetical protein
MQGKSVVSLRKNGYGYKGEWEACPTYGTRKDMVRFDAQVYSSNELALRQGVHYIIAFKKGHQVAACQGS